MKKKHSLFKYQQQKMRDNTSSQIKNKINEIRTKINSE